MPKTFTLPSGRKLTVSVEPAAKNAEASISGDSSDDTDAGSTESEGDKK